MTNRQKLAIGLWLLGSCTLAQTDIWRSDSLQEVVVTGTGTQHLLKNAPVQTEVITSRMLKDYGGKSLEDILAGLTASFAFNEDDMGSQMQLNGLGNDYILVLIDGKRIHGDVGGQNDLSLIDPQNIEKIEIVKGASSALYGSDAIAGVVNIITKKRNEGFLIENTTRGGSYGDLRQHNGLGLAIGRLKSYTNFHLQHSDGWQNTSIEDPRQTEFLIEDSRNMTVNRHTNWQVSERLTYEPLKGLELYAEGSTYWKRIYRPSGKYSADMKFYDMEYRNQSLAAGGIWKWNKTDQLTLDVNWDRHAYYYYYTAEWAMGDGLDQRGNFTTYYPYFRDDEVLQSDQRRTMAHLKGIFSLPYNNRLSGGLEWRHDYLEAPMRVDGGVAKDNTAAAYVQDEFSHVFTPRLSANITAGLRLNHNEQFGFRLTPKVSGMLSIGENIRLRATWSQGFKTPTPKEQHYRYVKYMNATYLYIGNEDLTPQTSNYYAVSGEWNWQGLNVTVTGYLNNVDNMITLVTIPNSQAPAEYIVTYDPRKTRQYQNLESAKTKGIDVSVRYRLNRDWMLGASYSYLDTDAKKYDTTHDRLVDVTIDGMAHHKGSWFATWNHAFSQKYNMGLGLYGRMSSKRYYQIDGDGKGYQIWRLSTNHEFPVSKKWLFRVEAGIDNIFDYVDRTYHGLHLGTTTPGRTVYGTLTVRFTQGKKLRFSNNKSNLKSNNNEED